MIYSENIPNNTKSTIRVTLSNFSNGIDTNTDENILPLNSATNTFNYDFSSGALRDGLGIKELVIKNATTEKTMVIPQNVEKILKFWHFRRYDSAMQHFSPLMLIYCNDGKVYSGRLSTLDTAFYDIGLTFSTEPVGINYRLDGTDSFLLCVPNEIAVYDGSLTPDEYTQNVPSITSAALHAERLFVTTGGDESQLWFSDDLNPTNWNVNEFDGGYIELTDERGCLKKVIEANNYLYIIREYGISRVSGWGMQDEFTVKNLYLTTGKLYYNSAVLCGNVIMMLCRDGIYRFDGSTMQKLNLGIDKFFENCENDDAVGAFLDGKYYLACKLNFGDGRTIGDESNTSFTNNALIEYDLDNGNINILRGVDIKSLTAFQTEWFSKLVICVNGDNASKLYELTHDGKIENTTTTKIWTSPYTDLGYPQYQKVLKNLYINTDNALTVEINANGKTYEYSCSGYGLPAKIPINLKVRKFSITFKSETQNTNISSPLIEAELC